MGVRGAEYPGSHTEYVGGFGPAHWFREPERRGLGGWWGQPEDGPAGQLG